MKLYTVAQDVRICSGDTASGSNDTDDQSSIIIDRKSILDKTTPPNSPNIGMQYQPQLGIKQNNWYIILIYYLLLKKINTQNYLLALTGNYVKL